MNPFTRFAPAFLLPLAVFLCGAFFPCSAAGEQGRKLTLLEKRPCGPDCIKGPLRLLLFQGCAGADFRPACIRHDAGYDTCGMDKESCDLQFLHEMLEASKMSKLPGFARHRARMAYFGVKRFGDSAWISAQEIARRKANGEAPQIVPPAPRPFARWFHAGSGARSSDALVPSITK